MLGGMEAERKKGEREQGLRLPNKTEKQYSKNLITSKCYQNRPIASFSESLMSSKNVNVIFFSPPFLLSKYFSLKPAKKLLNIVLVCNRTGSSLMSPKTAPVNQPTLLLAAAVVFLFSYVRQLASMFSKDFVPPSSHLKTGRFSPR